MKNYVLKRIILSIVTIFVIITITFFLMNLIPGGPFTSDRVMEPAVEEALKKQYNLDKPLPVQYVLYLKNIIHGDFGISLKSGRSITDIILSSFGISFKIGLCAIILAVVVGVILGVICALYKDSFIDRLIVVISTFIVSVPSFVIASFILFIVCIELKLLPVWSQGEKNIILPVIAMSLSPIAVIIKYMRSSMIETLSEDYIRTAKAKGVPKMKTVFVHALKNAIMPIITYLGPLTAGMITGSIVVEQIFTIGGLGSEFLTCINNKDYPLILGITIFFSIIIVFTNLISDLLYKAVNPRIKF